MSRQPPSRRVGPGWRPWLTLALLLGAGGLVLRLLHDPGSAPPAEPHEAPTASAPVPAGDQDGFQDVTHAVGLDAFVHEIVDGRLSNIIESLGSGAVFLDYDGDGRLDLYLVQGAFREGVCHRAPAQRRPDNRLLRQLPDGTFADVTPDAGVGDTGFGTAAAAADYDNDGDPDLYVVNVGPNVLYRNEGDGTFTDVTAEAGAGHAGTGVGAVFFDADGDGLLDLFIVNYLEFDPTYRHYYGPDAFPGPLAYSAETNVLLRNQGGGRFVDVSRRTGVHIPGHRGMAVAAFDLERDGDQDLYITNDGTANLLLVNDGTGHFRDAAGEVGAAYGQNGEATGSMAADVGDCNGDGITDILVTDTSYGSLYTGRTDGGFTDRVMRSGLAPLMAQYVSWGGNFLDYDNDGDPDVFVANGDLHRLVGWEDLLLENLGNGTYRDAGAAGGTWFRARLCGRGSAVADYDNDGRLDVLVTNLADRPVLLANRARNDNHWLKLDLEGTQSNRDGLGALIAAECGERRILVEARLPTGYLCQGDPRIHLGLGPFREVARLTIRWPSGRRQVLENVTADRILHVLEPGGER